MTRGTPTAPVAQPLEALLAGLRLALCTGSRQDDRQTLCRVIDWLTVAGLATHHRVGTLFLQGIQSAGVPIADTAVERELARRRRRHVERGMRQLRAMRRAVAALTTRDIPVLVLKGLPLGQRLYGSPFAKSSVDIDLLVPPETLAAAGRTLRDLGWRRTMPDFPDTPARARWCDRVHDEHVFIGAGGKLDLHPNLLGNPFLFDPSFAHLDANGVTIEIAGSWFRTLGDADQLLYLACHGSLHYWERLKWLCDFARLVSSLDDDAVAQTMARGEAEGLGSAVAPALLLCRNALHVETAADVLHHHPPRIRFVAALSRRTWIPRGGAVGQIVRKAAIRAGRFLIGSGLRYTLYEIRGLLIRPADFGRVNLPDCLFWLYVPLRPMLWILRLLRGQAH